MSCQPLPPLDRSRVRALIFDIDGTLSDSDDQMVESIASFLAPLASVFPPHKAARFSRDLVHLIERPGNWFLELLDRLHLDGLLARVLDLRALRFGEEDLTAERFPVIPGVIPMLDQLKSRYPLAIVSARNQATTRQFLTANNLDPYFEVILHSQSLPLTKPFPDPLLHAAQVLGVDIQECLMIGDTATDVKAARAAGAWSLSVLCGFGREKELRRAGTHAILPSTSELAIFLETGEGALP